YDPTTDSWIGVPATNATSVKNPNGYIVFVRGNRLSTAFNSPVTETVLRTKGPLYTGDQAPIIVSPNKYASVGNPYASALDLRNITTSGLKDFFYLWDPNIGGQFGYGGYQTLSDNGNGDYEVTPGGGSFGASGSVNNYVRSGWAFFVQATPSGGSVTFKETDKSNSSGQISTAAKLPTPKLRANLLSFNADNSTQIADGLLVNYKDDYSNAVDTMDAIKQVNSSENLAVKNKNTLLVIERRHTIIQSDTIFLNLTNVSAKKYRFEFTADQIYQPGLTGFLEDAYLHTSTPLNIDGVTDLDFSVVNVAASYAPNRFMVVFHQSSTLPVTFTSVKASLQNENIKVEWKVDNEQNIKQYEVEKSVDGNHFTNLSVIAATANNGHSAAYSFVDKNAVEGFNYYRIKSVDDNGKISYTNIVKVVVASIKAEIAVYPNPVINNQINLQLNNQPDGNYAVRLFTKAGQLILEKKIPHSAGSNVEPIQLSNYIAHGIYELKVTKPDGNITSINIIYQ
ncbi:MAG: T9SS type A sorting domain-containing protein, partial [Bacteroidota bacterium]|nr:T9SS type A sorting domain-containing protein [Bacteroidota bacterium]